MKRLPAGVFLALGLAAAARADSPSTPASPTGCVECHLALDDSRMTPPAKAFSDDVHARAGLTCAACHGGDPKSQDQEIAHDPRRGFRGKPTPFQIPALCGDCHADAARMRQFNPTLRVDQLSEYRTSGHGKQLLKGNAKVATCESCHGAHGMLPVKDSRSPVYPTRVAQTCDRCHGDEPLMTAHRLPSDVYARYARSVHFEAMTKKGDLSAPTCNSCHGNHGAAPPQVASVANVCGTCHTIFADQFKNSPHGEAFAEMGLPGCVTCHENHEVVHPTDAFLADGAESKCAGCHEAGSAGAVAAAQMHADLRRLELETGEARSSLRVEAEAGMEVSRIEFDLSRAAEALTKARTDVHLFQASVVRKATEEGLTVAREAKTAAVRVRGEREFRRKGLFVSLGLILVAIAALVAKIRDVDRHRPR
jgi:hypothetical protein